MLLKQVAEPVEELTPHVSSILSDLSDTTDASPGFALAAPQIGELVRAICVDATQAKRETKTPNGKILLVNPEIIETGEAEINREGCLSVPKYTADIKRYQFVKPKLSGSERHGVSEQKSLNLGESKRVNPPG
jgi:peptide deformylase